MFPKHASSLPARCWAEIDLLALERNLHRIRAALPEGIRYVAVVKADAYGHGLHATVARLMQAGADCFAVATLSEAAAIREIGSGWRVLALSALLPEEFPKAVELGVEVTVSTARELDLLEEAAAAQGVEAAIHLKVDTGMGRLGVWHEQATPLYERIRDCPHLRLAGVFTHFSSAEDDPEFTCVQRQRLLDALARFEGLDTSRIMIHADNSAGLGSFSKGSPFNAVRIGLLQFGIPPYPGSLFGGVSVEPVLSFHTRITVIKDLPAGVSIGYGRTCVLKRPTRTAVIAAGYGDGIPRAASNRAHVLVRGRRCPILGRVSMDQTVIDVTDLPEVRSGDGVVLIGGAGGERITTAEFSAWGDTIAWETLCSITKRVPRMYRGAAWTSI